MGVVKWAGYRRGLNWAGVVKWARTKGWACKMCGVKVGRGLYNGRGM